MEEFPVMLTVREMRALANCANMLTAALWLEVKKYELDDEVRAPESGAMKLEVATLVATGEAVS